MKTIAIHELEKRIKGGETLRLLDVRSPTEFAHVHADGACLIPVDELSPATLASAKLNVDPDDPIYVLCHSGSRAAKACDLLGSMGINHAVRVDGGTVAWVQAHLPVSRSGPNISIERQVRIIAGGLMLIGLVLAWLVHPAWSALSAFVGAGLVFAGVTDFCGMGILLGKLPWNQQALRKTGFTDRPCRNLSTPSFNAAR